MVDRSGHRVLKGRFELLERLKTEGRNRAFVGRDLTNDTRVFVKQLPWSEIRDWKTVELFEREAATLRAISHPNLPRFVDAFHFEEEPKLGFFLVQQFVTGKNLRVHIDTGKALRERSLGMIAESVLKALHALHTNHPALIHRDVKPANIVSDVEQIVLVDLGAVGTAPLGLALGETVAGTPGYMAPEQTNGRAVPASDLYALGLTLIHAASLVHPSKLPVERLRIQFRDVVSLSEPWLAFLERLVEPAIEDRFPSAAAALSSMPVHRSRSERPQVPVSPRIESAKAPLELELEPAVAAPTFALEPVIAAATLELEPAAPARAASALQAPSLRAPAPEIAAPAPQPPPAAPAPVPAVPLTASAGALDLGVQLPVPVEQTLDDLLERALNRYPLRQLAEGFRNAPFLWGVFMLLGGFAMEWATVESRMPTALLLERRANDRNLAARAEAQALVRDALGGSLCFRDETSNTVNVRVEFEGDTGIARAARVLDGGSSIENECLREKLMELSLTAPGRDDQVVQIVNQIRYGKVSSF